MMCEVREQLQSRAIEAVEDTSEAQWLVEGLDPTFETVGSLVPLRFEAYARILHPAWRVRRKGDRLVHSPVRWSEVAELRDTKAHRLMQWPQVWALPLFDDSAIEYCVDAGLAPTACPDEGRLPRQVARKIQQVLSAHTDTAAPCWFGVWIGFGHEYREGIPETRRLAAEHREWDLFRAPLGALNLNFFDVDEFFYQSANIVWPDDRSWCLATDIDLNSSYLGGTKALIEAVREQGLSVVMISHNLSHVFSVADRIMVLRGGRNVGTLAAHETTTNHVVSLITGTASGPEQDAPGIPS